MEKSQRLKGKVGVWRGRQQAQSEGRKLVGTESQEKMKDTRG